ncbi:MAG: hypothetical protein HY943_05095 [Gammaproteobacteria bacterium]|nr:hypothetical protein [Gammaproteobacteria bacterium]
MTKAIADADKLAKGRQPAIRYTEKSPDDWRRLAGPICDNPLAPGMQCFLSEDAPEGMAASREKRLPKFPVAQ